MEKDFPSVKILEPQSQRQQLAVLFCCREARCIIHVSRQTEFYDFIPTLHDARPSRIA